jgi:hypothetical protein
MFCCCRKKKKKKRKKEKQKERRSAKKEEEKGGGEWKIDKREVKTKQEIGSVLRLGEFTVDFAQHVKSRTSTIEPIGFVLYCALLNHSHTRF